MCWCSSNIQICDCTKIIMSCKGQNIKRQRHCILITCQRIISTNISVQKHMKQIITNNTNNNLKKEADIYLLKVQKNNEKNQRHWTMSMNKNQSQQKQQKTIEFEKLKIIDMTSNSYQISSKYAFEFMMRLLIYIYISLYCLYFFVVFCCGSNSKHKTRIWNWWLNIIANEWLDYQCIVFFFNIAILGMSDCMRMNSIRVSLQNSTSGKPFPFNIQYHITDGFFSAVP